MNEAPKHVRSRTQSKSSCNQSLCDSELQIMWPYLSNILVAGNVGIMVFFTVAVAPTIFTTLPPQWSAAYVRKFFPRYFFFLGITTAAATLGASKPAHQLALLACTLIFFFSCFWLTPRINRARDDKNGAVFKRLHWVSVGLNMVQLFTFVWLLLPYSKAA